MQKNTILKLCAYLLPASCSGQEKRHTLANHIHTAMPSFTKDTEAGEGSAEALLILPWTRRWHYGGRALKETSGITEIQRPGFLWKILPL